MCYNYAFVLYFSIKSYKVAFYKVWWGIKPITHVLPFELQNQIRMYECMHTCSLNTKEACVATLSVAYRIWGQKSANDCQL